MHSRRTRHIAPRTHRVPANAAVEAQLAPPTVEERTAPGERPSPQPLLLNINPASHARKRLCEMTEPEGEGPKGERVGRKAASRRPLCSLLLLCSLVSALWSVSLSSLWLSGLEQLSSVRSQLGPLARVLCA